ncbi:putative G2/mitotic-specific cyclin-B [Patellaria atrata CBS 101060]|uniref:G2/mitotic-specific cyclin-B n=1 Tax=Patellaria atrata CBS 101060 TaxID=1346257 RepID=A0A9P4VSX9_9PEZI|nr:putative G2/mitotic-specific cyclin-B [Patellaria atrata CBS 101060]
MPAGRPRQRVLTNENDENVGTTRVTRAKAAALTTTKDSNAGDPPKKALQSKKSTNALGTNGTLQTRKRPALGDVSNVPKNDVTESKAGKKPVPTKSGLVSKAAQPTGITKASRTNSTRSVLGAKDKNVGSSELKRPASGSGVSGPVTKKRNTSSTSTAKSVVLEVDDEDSENIVPNKQTSKATVSVEIEKTVHVEESIKISGARYSDETEELNEPATLPPDVPDLDTQDHDDPLMVSDYVVEIFDYLRELERTTMANADYMDVQTELEWKMRGILVDWLLEVHTRFRLLPETLFLAVNIIDRFLSSKIVQLDRLQLVGVTAMFIASKYEEVLSPHVTNFRHVADDGFSEEEILSAERFVLAALNYDLSYPNPMNFLRRISKADNYDIQTRTLGKYLLEISCLDHRFIAHPPSEVAAAAMYLARIVLDRGEWDATLAHYAGYTEEELTPCFHLMVDYLRSPVVHEAFFKKYASKKFMKASIVLRQWAKKWHHLYLNEDRASNGS